MGLTGSTVDVPLRPINQQAPVTSAAVGEIAELVNGMVREFKRDAVTTFKLEKRWGFAEVTTAVKTPETGDNAAAIVEPKLMATMAQQLVIADQNNPVVLAENANQWSRFNHQMPTRTLSQETVYTGNTQAEIPDGACVGGVYCYAWREGREIKVIMVDDNGAVVREPFLLASTLDTTSPNNVKVKVVSDVENFWIFWSKGQDLAVSVFSPAGVHLSTIEIDEIYFREGLGPSPWDVQYNIHGVSWIGTVSGGFTRLWTFTIAAGVITPVSTDLFAMTTTDGIAYLINDLADSNVYVSSDFAGYRISLAKAVTATFPIGILTLRANNISGYAMSGNRLRVYVSFVNGPDQTLSYTRAFVLNAGAPLSADVLMRTTTVASRTFVLDQRKVNVLYYGSVSSTVFAPSVQQLGQPTYFLLDCESGQIVGRWDYGKAAMDWVESENLAGTRGGTSGDWHLSTPFATGAVLGDDDFMWHLPLGYRAQNVNAIDDTGLVGSSRSGIGHFNLVPITYVKQVSTVGVKDTRIGAHGRAVDYAGEMLIPGPLATAFDGYNFTEAGINLAPERPAGVASNTASGALSAPWLYEYIVVFEATSPLGDRIWSQPCLPVQVAMNAPNDTVTLTGISLHMSNRDNVIISVYRTFVENGVMSTDHRKVSNDLAPLLNNPLSATWTFVDTASDAAAASGEVLYTDLNKLYRDPCPAFSAGCTFNNRTFVIGYDGAIWFSGEKTPGEALWFNEDVQRIFPPTAQRFVACFPLDGRIVFQTQCQQYFLPGGVFPDATGAGGNIPTPELLPFTHGGTGHWCLIRDGALYAASSGGCWLMTRGLESKQISADVVDDFHGREISGISVDKDQRVMISTVDVDTDVAENVTMVFDVVSGAWSKWTHFHGQPILSAQLRGRYIFTVGSNMYHQVEGTYTDDGEAIISKYRISPVHIGGVKNYKRVWRIHFYGTYYADHDLTVDVSYDDNVSTTVTQYVLTPDPATPFLYELPPTVELCSSMGFTFIDSFPRGNPGNSFALEMLSFYVALEKGLNRIPTAQRIAPGATYVVPGGDGVSISTVNSINGTGTTLVALPVVGLVSDVFFVWVKSRGRLYRLTDNSGVAADGVDIVTASDGRQWMVV